MPPKKRPRLTIRKGICANGRPSRRQVRTSAVSQASSVASAPQGNVTGTTTVDSSSQGVPSNSAVPTEASAAEVEERIQTLASSQVKNTNESLNVNEPSTSKAVHRDFSFDGPSTSRAIQFPIVREEQCGSISSESDSDEEMHSTSRERKRVAVRKPTQSPEGQESMQQQESNIDEAGQEGRVSPQIRVLQFGSVSPCSNGGLPICVQPSGGIQLEINNNPEMNTLAGENLRVHTPARHRSPSPPAIQVVQNYGSPSIPPVVRNEEQDPDVSHQDIHEQEEDLEMDLSGGFDNISLDSIEDQVDDEDEHPIFLGFERENISPHYCEAMNQICQFCDAKFFKAERTTRKVYSKCCGGGKIRLPPLNPCPRIFIRLLSGDDAQSRCFKKDIVSYNGLFEFASLHANLQTGNLPGRGPWLYRIQGTIYCHYSDLNVDRESYKCGPLYWLDPNEAARQRIENAQQFRGRPELIEELGNVLSEVNPFAQQYRHLHDVYSEQIERNPDVLPNICMEFLCQRRNRNDREHDPIEVNEVAAIYHYNENEVPNRQLRVFLTNEDGATRALPESSELIDPLCFPLLFPRGDRGWNYTLTKTDGKKVSVLQFYAYRLAHRRRDDEENEHFSTLRHGGHLTQKLIVAAYLKVESERLLFIRRNQKKLRSENYTGLIDYLGNRAEREGANIGRMVILPSTFITSPRSQMERFQDALTVASNVGYPSLFITFTANPRWREVTENLPRGDNEPSNHPLLICRVFKMKLDELMRDLTKNHIMGVSIAHLYVIEFQKRGLPHAHILITLRNQDKPTDPERIDRLVCAEIPNPETENDLHQLVSTHMIHGPCGELNPDSVCMNDGKCNRNFPKYWYNHTTISNGRVNYRRRKNGREIEVRRNNRTFRVSNQFVVPYNPYLLLKYQTHVNIEVCTSMKTIKYLYKYFFKGPDEALLRIIQQPGADGNEGQVQIHYDEITSFVNGRYMTPPEASWHLLCFNFHEMSHSVQKLPIHLPNEQNVVFEEGQEQEAVEGNSTTKLLQWFETNKTDPDARHLFYAEFPIHYVWLAREKKWRKRQRMSKAVVARIYNVSIKNGELYYLRVLLLNVHGAKSFEDLRTVNGRICGTFQEACNERNLLAGDAEWFRCLQEASEREMPRKLRQMFSYILVFGIVASPLTLWQQFKRQLSEDFVHRRRMNETDAENESLKHIQSILTVHGRDLSDFALPQPPQGLNENDVDDEDVDQQQQQHIDIIQITNCLNNDQRNCFNIVRRAIENDAEPRRLFFIQGAAGTGKTFLYNSLLKYCASRNFKSAPVAWTGLAASLLQGGRTVHSLFKIPLELNEQSTSSISYQSTEAQFLRDVKLIIWDEISMTTKVAFNVVERALRYLCDCQRTFGGKCVVVGGDFKQCLPVVIGGDRTTIVSNCVKSSQHWPLFESITLHENMRIGENEEEFRSWLEKLGTATFPVEPALRRRQHLAAIPEQCIVPDVDTLIEKVFGDLQPHQVPNKAILTPLNESCHHINLQMFDRFDSPSKIYESVDSIQADNQDEEFLQAIYPLEFLHTVTPSGFPQHTLSLKVGTVVMLLRNLDIRDGLCNGTRLLIKSLAEHFIEVEKLDCNCTPTGDIVFIPKIDFVSEGTSNYPFKLQRRQFPLRVAYAITITKAQGQTFDTVGIYLPQPVFTHGQLYVAFSRARSINDVFVCLTETTRQGQLIPDSTSMYTPNIVYKEVLQ